MNAGPPLTPKGPSGEPEDGKKKRQSPGLSKRWAKLLDDEGPPLFGEVCDICQCAYLSNVRFENVIIRGHKPIHRVCQFCIKQMSEGPNGELAPRRAEAGNPADKSASQAQEQGNHVDRDDHGLERT